MLEKFEKYISKIKEKMGSKMLSVITFCLIGIITILSFNMVKTYTRSNQKSSNEYNKILYDTIGYMKTVEVFSEKARITTSQQLETEIFVKILSNSNFAKDGLSTLPIDQSNLNQVFKFLTQTADFSEYAIKKLVNTKLEQKDYDVLESINKNIMYITEVLDDVYEKANEKNIDWKEIEELLGKDLEGNTQVLLTGVSSMKNNFTEYDGLIYDGAYSSHLENSEPQLLQNMEEVSIEKAQEKAIECVENKFKGNVKAKINKVKYINEIEGKLKLYQFEITLDSGLTVTVQITKKGGLLYLMVQDKEVKERNIEVGEAKVLGREYLKKIGIEQVEETYTLEENNMITINYASVQDGVLIYTDLIKIKLAMDNGEVCSVETSGYIFNHHNRESISVTATEEEAKSVVNNKIQIDKVRLCIIPNKINQEVLAYELFGTVEKRNFLIYVNANNLEEEQVLLLLETKGGNLTM